MPKPDHTYIENRACPHCGASSDRLLDNYCVMCKQPVGPTKPDPTPPTPSPEARGRRTAMASNLCPNGHDLGTEPGCPEPLCMSAHLTWKFKVLAPDTSAEALASYATECFRAAIEPLQARVGELEAEYTNAIDLIEKQGRLLTGVVNAVKGEPPELVLWSHHDAPEIVREALAAKDAELRRRDREWQEHLMPLHPDYTGDGCESGDPRDWTFAAIRLQMNELQDERDEARAELRRVQEALGVMTAVFRVRVDPGPDQHAEHEAMQLALAALTPKETPDAD